MEYALIAIVAAICLLPAFLLLYVLIAFCSYRRLEEMKDDVKHSTESSLELIDGYPTFVEKEK